MISITCGLLFQHSNAFIHIKCLKQMKGYWFWLHTQVLGNTQAGLEAIIVTKNVLSLSKRLLKTHTKVIETWLFFMHENFTLKDQSTQPSTNRQCFGMSPFQRHHPTLHQKASINHQRAPTTHHLEVSQWGSFRLGNQPLCQGPGFLFKNILHR